MPIQSIPNEQQLEDDGVPLNDFRRNKNETFSINSDRITSMEKIKVTRTRPNSMLNANENERTYKPAISFVSKRPHPQVEHLHGEELIPVSNDQHSNIHRSQKKVDRRSVKERKKSN